MDSTHSQLTPLAVFCEHDNKTSNFLKDRKVLDQMNAIITYSLCRTDSLQAEDRTCDIEFGKALFVTPLSCIRKQAEERDPEIALVS
jgi:hypothetical protein